jgi:hypothetical protein
MITQSSNADVADWGLELDQRVSSVVAVGWAGLTVGTEVGVVADGALVAVTLDESLVPVLGVAKGTVTVDAVVAGLAAV